MASATVYKKYQVDAMPLVGNCAAIITSGFATQNGTTFDSMGAPNGQRVAYVRVIRSAIGGAFNIYENGYLDSTAWEGGPTSFGTGNETMPDSTGGLSPWHPAGANVIWLPDGSLAAIYRTRASGSGPWQHWWRINRMGGEQQFNYDLSGNQGTYGTVSAHDGSTYTNQPPVSSGVMGNWSAREAITLPTSDWCQIAHGQGRVVALYSLGTLTQSDRRVVQNNGTFPYLETPRSTFTRTTGDLYCIYSLDNECKTWSDPILIAESVSPVAGGICWTGAEWVCAYMDGSVSGKVKRTANLADWDSGPIASNVIRPADTTTYPSYSHLLPAKELYCYGLAYDAQRDMINGIWAGYDDYPQQYDYGFTNGGGYEVHDTIWYGWYDSVVSPDQGRTWRLAQPSAWSTIPSIINDGGACVVNETALIRDPRYNGKLLHSTSAFQIDNGLLIG